MLLQETKNLLKKYNFQPIHGRGQNFLIDEKILEKIVDSANLKSNDVILEVGPGMGVLTKELAKRAKKVIAVELDKNLVKVLKQELKDYKNIEIISGNILEFGIRNSEFGIGVGEEKSQIPNSKSPAHNYKIVANLPYNITSKFIRTFLEAKNKPTEMILMVQKEVAERIVAKPGQMSILGVACQFYADCKIKFIVKKTSFWPIPKVDSAVISLKSIKFQPEAGQPLAGKVKKNLQPVIPSDPPTGGESKDLFANHSVITSKDFSTSPASAGSDRNDSEELFFKIVRAGFSSKRKKLKSNLAKGLDIKKETIQEIFDKLELKENIRAQELSVNDWKKLVDILREWNIHPLSY